MNGFSLPNYIIESLSHGALHLLIVDVLNEKQFKEYSWFKNFEQSEYLPYFKAYIADQIEKEIVSEARILGNTDIDEYDDKIDDFDDFEDEDEYLDEYDQNEIIDFEDEDDLSGLDDYDGEIVYYDELGEDDEISKLSSDAIIQEVYEGFITNRQKIISMISDFDLELTEASQKIEDLRSDYILKQFKIYSINNMKTTKEFYDLSKNDAFIMKKINENSALSSFPVDQKNIILKLVKCIMVYNKITDDQNETDLELTSNYMDNIIGEAIDLYTSSNDKLSDIVYARDLTRKYIRSLKKIIKENGFDK